MANYIATIGGIKNEVIVRLGIATTAGYYTDAILDDWIDAAHRWAAGYKKWAFTEGRYSTTAASLSTSEDGYTTLEYPEGFRSDSIRLLTVNGKRFDKKNFYKFQSFLEDNSNDTSNIFTDFVRKVYINPRSSITGTVTVWGQVVPAHFDYTDPTQTTVFSNYDENGNHAIVEEVLYYASERERRGESRDQKGQTGHSLKAITLLDSIVESLKDEQFAYQDTDNDGMFQRVDVVNGDYYSDSFKRDQF
jgi:hypothetical protein